MFFKNYTCFFYETVDGKRPVEDFIKSLDEHTQDKFIYKKELLEYFGPALRHPHTDSVGDSIFELRFRGSEGQVRVLFFFFHKKQIILLHGFVKKTRKTPAGDIKTAKKRMCEYLNK
jgi:phage-related protein